MILYFYPGLGADSGLAPFHAIPGFDIRWIEWPDPDWFAYLGNSHRMDVPDSHAFGRMAARAGIRYRIDAAIHGAPIFRNIEKDHLDLFYRMASGLTGKQVRAMIRLSPAAAVPNPPECPELRIHGVKVRILPFGNQTSDFGIERGGHLISMTNSNEINGILAKWLAEQP